MSEAQDILDLIRQRQGLPPKVRTVTYDNDLEKIQSNPLSREDWYKFSKNHIEEFDGSKVNSETGMSDREFLDYMKDSESLFGLPHGEKPTITSTKKLKEFLSKLGEDYPKFNETVYPLFEGLEEDFSGILEEPDPAKKNLKIY